MKSQKLGTSISRVEVLNISIHGIWLYVRRREYFLSYEDYPWFKNAKVIDICAVELIFDSHLCWPALDIDLDLDSLENPEKYPLKYK